MKTSKKKSKRLEKAEQRATAKGVTVSELLTAEREKLLNEFDRTKTRKA